MDALRRPRERIQAFTMPGFGTTQPHARQRPRPDAAARRRGARGRYPRPVPGGDAGPGPPALRHRPGRAGRRRVDQSLRRLPADNRDDLVFENVQARMRTSLLMNAGFVIGTGDVSELALGWCTYNGDHMSMYNPNSSIPKTLVKFLVDWAAHNEFDGEARHDAARHRGHRPSRRSCCRPTTRARSCRPPKSAIGPYELHDFFLYHFLRYGAPPEKILFLAEHARFTRAYTADELRSWLEVFMRRFFANQFKRSCLPDGPKVGSISLSPRGDWRMPSDAQAPLWLAWAVDR